MKNCFHTDDPVELMLARALLERKIDFIHESKNKEQRLDFYLPEIDLFIEVKRFSTPRTAKQIEGYTNVMVLQGIEAVQAFIKLI